MLGFISFNPTYKAEKYVLSPDNGFMKDLSYYNSKIQLGTTSGHSQPIAVITLDVLTKCNYNTAMKFEWDETKRKSNIKKHGIDFIDAPNIFAGYTLTIEDDRYDYEKERFVTFGILEGRIVAVVHTETEELIRIISIRKATQYEEKEYFSQIPD
jgi:uncharacterized protein